MINLSGTPGVKTSVTNLSIITANVEKGIICVLAATKRGLPGKFYKVGNWIQHKRKLGGLIEGNDDALINKLALEYGAVLYVGRLFHLTDPDDVGTITGTKATATIDEDVAEVLAVGSIDITGGTVSAGVNQLSAITVDGVDILGGAIDFNTDNATTAADAAAAITANTSSPNYTATSSGDTINIEAVAGSGDSPNGFVVAGSGAGDVTVGNPVAMAGGVTQVQNEIIMEAEAVGDGYNGTVIVISEAASNKAGYVDITVTLPDSDTTAAIADVLASDVSQAAIDKVNAKLLGVDAGVQVDSVTGSWNVGEMTLAGGVQDLSELVDADYIGSQISQTGLHVFDSVTDSMRIVNTNRAVPEVDLAFADYAAQRKDMRAAVRSALGLGVTGIHDYRLGTGVYSHSPIDSFYCDFWYSDCEITDPSDSDIKNKAITALAFKMASRSRKDREAGEWFSDSGNQSGIGSFSRINRIPINFLSPAFESDYDTLYEDGINAIVNDNGYIAPFGNRSCLRDKTSLLSKMNIADLVVYISRSLKQIASIKNFDQNDLEMFKDLYRRVRPFIVDLVTNRAIWGTDDGLRGEGEWWYWFGDQEATSLNDLSFNTEDDISAGKYRCRFAFAPKAANEYIAIDIAPADIATIQNVEVLT